MYEIFKIRGSYCFGENMRKLDILHSHDWLYFVIQESKPWEKLNDLPQAMRD